MPDWDGQDDDGDEGAASSAGGYAPLDGSVNLAPPAGGFAGASDGTGVTFHPLTDPALDQHYANLANQYDPAPPSGALGTFQQLPPDGTSDRWRYMPPNIPGEPMKDEDSNPCAAWLISRPSGQTSGSASSSSRAGGLGAPSPTTQSSTSAGVTQVDPITVMGHRNLVDQIGDVGGKAWGALNTAVGLSAAVAGYAAAKVMGTHPEFHLGNNAIQVTGIPNIIGQNEVGTLGNVQLYEGNAKPADPAGPYVPGLPDRSLGAHEEAHTRQSQTLGLLYGPLWGALGGETADNPMERAADYYAVGKGGPFSHLDQGPMKIFGFKIR